MNARLRITRIRRAPTSFRRNGLDLDGIDLDRLTPSAREHFWFNLNRYAHRLFRTAKEISAAETRRPNALVTAQHVCSAEVQRMRRARRDERDDVGLIYVLDALQIVGAAVCGALATKVDISSDEGALSLAGIVIATIALFLVREVLVERTR